ncbi:MAG: aldo/keto reductase [Verrucomicrobia bacterium]|nr:aldo/keto reductase [Verrucomicrobiota bacterium]
MNLTRTAYGTWNGGRYMNFGEALDEPRYEAALRLAYDSGIRTFLTADVYASGAGDEALGRALAGVPRDSYCLVGMIGHDFYSGLRDGQKGFPRFTDPRLRQPRDYADYIRMATEKSLERCRTSHFDCLMLHNPDRTGYSQDSVWNGLQRVQDEKLATMLGVAPGPANGFTLDLLLCFERFGALFDWAMIILNPFEPWPGQMVLESAVREDISILTRVVDYGGIFHDDVRPGHAFGPRDHRTFRPAGWVEAATQKLEAIRPIAQRHGLTMLQLACLWNLGHAPVRSVVPTLIQEVAQTNGVAAKSIEDKIRELAALPEVQLTSDELAQILEVGNNKGCMALKGGSPVYEGEPVADQWPLNPELVDVAQRWKIEPTRDLTLTHRAA